MKTVAQHVRAGTLREESLPDWNAGQHTGTKNAESHQQHSPQIQNDVGQSHRQLLPHTKLGHDPVEAPVHPWCHEADDNQLGRAEHIVENIKCGVGRKEDWPLMCWGEMRPCCNQIPRLLSNHWEKAISFCGAPW